MSDPAVGHEAIRALHDAVARSQSDAEASTRDPSTTSRELRRMVAHLKSQLEPLGQARVLEVGCGTGVIAVPLCEASAQFVGLDISDAALSVLRAKLDHAGLARRATILAVDFTEADAVRIRELGEFDRIVVYATLHFATDDAEAALFVHRVVDLLAPGGTALLGNLPLGELASERSSLLAGLGHWGTLRSLGWMMTPATPPVPRSRFWRWRVVGAAAARRITSSRGPGPALAPGTTVELTTSKLEAWLQSAGADLTWQWLAPHPWAPLALGRADLLVRRPLR